MNGQRETSNYFSVNGSDAEEDVNAGTAIIPNLDAIAEFRIVTSNFDAEYGEFSGGQVSVVTKSGSNGFHGSAFDFLRNTDLDARNYFSPLRGAYRQNQYGGTIGGPIRRDKVFYFLDYQGTRQTQGIDTGEISVPSNADRTGDLSDLVDSNGNSLLTGTVGGPYFANLLTQKLGYAVYAGRALLLQRLLADRCTDGKVRLRKCADSAERVVCPGAANAAIHSRSEQRQRLCHLRLQSDAATTTRRAARMDANTRWGLLSAYYFIDDFNLDNPYPNCAERSQRSRLRCADHGPGAAFGSQRHQSHQHHHSE